MSSKFFLRRKNNKKKTAGQKSLLFVRNTKLATTRVLHIFSNGLRQTL